jgi:hypothetical protein
LLRKLVLAAASATVLPLTLLGAAAAAHASPARHSTAYVAHGQVKGMIGASQKYCITAAHIKANAVVLVEKCAPKAAHYANQDWAVSYNLGSIKWCLDGTPYLCLEAGGTKNGSAIGASLYDDRENNKKVSPQAAMSAEVTIGAGTVVQSVYYRGKYLASLNKTISTSQPAVFQPIPEQGKKPVYIWNIDFEPVNAL